VTPDAEGNLHVTIFRNFLTVQESALTETDDLLKEKYNGIVQSGPFKGMKLDCGTAWRDGNACTKLVGSYEFELHAAVEKAISRAPNFIINVGCAEGYYAIGLGHRLPYAVVHAMDMDDKALDQCAKNGMNNGIIGMTLVHGKVGPEDLSRGGDNRLYVVDIEGYELAVLDPQRCPELLISDIIVECHDFFYVGENESPTSIISDSLTERFRETHEIERIEPQAPCLGDYPCLSGLVLGKALLAITEKRPLPTAWLACWAKERRI